LNIDPGGMVVIFAKKQEKILMKKLFPIGKKKWVGENDGKK
jgi:hypothetical protein